MRRDRYRLGLYEKAMPGNLTWPEKLAAAKRAGFDCVEISIDETDSKLARLDMPVAERLELLGAMAKSGVHLESMCLSGHRRYPLGSEDAAVRARSLEIMEKAVVLARDLGIRVIQIAGYDEYYNPSNERTKACFAENLAKSVELAARYNVMLAFETMETPFLNTVKKAMHWVRENRSPYLMVYPDCGNITNAAVESGGDVLADLRAGAGHIAALHLKETLPGKFREIPYGAGHVDFASIIACAWSLGVRRYTAEFWYTGAEDWQGDLQSAADFLNSFFTSIHTEN